MKGAIKNQSRLLFTDSYNIKSCYKSCYKIHNKRELQNLAANHLAEIDHKDFMKICRKCMNRTYSFLSINTTLPSDNPL